ncbi:hypothetical protein PIB30_033993 [Stylosanthes scabra]|uniref:Uncharacterized protein n=1 Tax=Stylosanthes scabra TaxID=79078 RepID=A0ABU6TCD5_9FABA|nr:hypothetical protein [Stylosanthes scabra]
MGSLLIVYRSSADLLSEILGHVMLGQDLSNGGFDVCVLKGFGPSRPNIRNSCPELGKADVFDIPGFTSCQACPERRGIVMLAGENFFWKFLKVFLEMAENQEATVPVAGAAQMPRELSPIYRWVSHDVLGASPTLSQEYLDELKLSGVIFGGGDLEGQYKVEAALPGDRVCYLNLDHPTVPNWLWVN